MAANDYVTLTEVEQAFPDLTSAQWTTGLQTLAGQLITRASRKIDKQTNRLPGAFAATSLTMYFDAPRQSINESSYHDNRLSAGTGGNRSLWIGELADTPTSVAISLDGSLTTYTALSSTDYIMWPYNALNEGRPYLRIDLDVIYGKYQTWYGFRKGVQVTGFFGYSKTAPDDLKQAIIIQVAKWLKRGQQRYQDVAVMTDPNQQIYKVFDPEFYEALDYYRIPAI